MAKEATKSAETKNTEQRAEGGFWEQVTTLGLAVLIALCVRQFVIEPFRIP
ncbi:MAG: signal peptidase I, partial [Myxococcales bacterium]|nr:signal peptidase I [Myxococcales bacterium]